MQAGDWALISIASFVSRETLTVIMQNGSVRANITREELERGGLTLEQVFFEVTEGLEPETMGGSGGEAREE